MKFSHKDDSCLEVSKAISVALAGVYTEFFQIQTGAGPIAAYYNKATCSEAGCTAFSKCVQNLNSRPFGQPKSSADLSNSGLCIYQPCHLWQLFLCCVGYCTLQPTCWWGVAGMIPRLDSSSAGTCSPPGSLLKILKEKTK